MRLTGRTSLPCFVFFSLLFALLVYWIGYERPAYGIDDANIYMVYMRHFAQGHGFVWNLGGEKVEGFTSLLWTLIGALFYKLSGERYVWLLLALSFILTFITVYRLLSFVRKCNGTQDQLITVSDVLIMALLLLPLGFIEWNILGLMETGLWFFLIVNTTLYLCSYYLAGARPLPLAFTAMLAIMILTRPESMAFGILFISILFVQRTIAEGVKRAIYATLLPLLTYGATLISLMLWRISYFGYPFPNTYYAKVSGSLKDNVSHGLAYLHKFFYEYPQAAFAFAAALVSAVLIFIKWRKKAPLSAGDKIQLVLLAVILPATCLPVLTGGDHFKYARFYQCIIPLLYAAVFHFSFWKAHLGNFSIPLRSHRILLTAAACFGICFIAKSTLYDFTATDRIAAVRISPEFYHARMGRTIAAAEDATFSGASRYPSVGILAAGGFAYAYNGITIDLMGLNDTAMAHATRIKQGFRNHASFDIKTFWKLRPDMVGTFYGGEIIKDTSMFNLSENTEYFRNGLFVYVAYKGIFDNEDFIASYLPALVRLKENDFWIFAYYNKDFLAALDKGKFDIFFPVRRHKPGEPHTPVNLPPPQLGL
jgi:hypothetical protein